MSKINKRTFIQALIEYNFIDAYIDSLKDDSKESCRHSIHTLNDIKSVSEKIHSSLSEHLLNKINSIEKLLLKKIDYLESFEEENVSTEL